MCNAKSNTRVFMAAKQGDWLNQHMATPHQSSITFEIPSSPLKRTDIYRTGTMHLSQFLLFHLTLHGSTFVPTLQLPASMFSSQWPCFVNVHTHSCHVPLNMMAPQLSSVTCFITILVHSLQWHGYWQLYETMHQFLQVNELAEPWKLCPAPMAHVTSGFHQHHGCHQTHQCARDNRWTFVSTAQAEKISFPTCQHPCGIFPIEAAMWNFSNCGRSHLRHMWSACGWRI